MQLTLNEIAGALSAVLLHGDPFKKIKGVSVDSRSIRPQELFIPLKGTHTDGHIFLKEVKRKKADAVLVRNNFPLEKIPRGLPFIRVRSPLHALGDLAGYYRRKFDIPVIAVTGSSGKTTVKDMLHAMLATKFQCLKTEGNFNNEIGLPLTLLRLGKGHEKAVLEMGTNRPGEIAYLTGISRPSIGVITNINPVHLEGLASIDGVRREKESLLLNMPQGAKAVLNYDDMRLRKMGKRFPGEVLTFGLRKDVRFRADEVRCLENGTYFRLNGRERFFLPLLGRPNLYNAIAAIAAASAFDISLKKMKHALESMEGLPHRLKVFEAGRVKIIDDTYNANPFSFRMAIDTLKLLGKRGRYIVVAGDMLELGNTSPRLHYELGYYIGRTHIDFLIAIGRRKKEISDGAKRGGLRKDCIKSASSSDEAARIVLKIVNPYDKILFKASRKAGLERAVNVLSSSLSSL